MKSSFFHIKYIQENDFDILNIDQVIKSIDEGKVFSKKSVAFTVDDAYESFYSVAWPYLKENNIPVTLFVSTESVDQNPGGYMSWDQIRNFVCRRWNCRSTYCISSSYAFA